MKIEDLYHFVLPDMPGCPDEELRKAFVLTAIDFARETQSWNEIADAVRLSDGEANYDIDYPSGAQAETVTEVWSGAYELHPITMSALPDHLPDWQTATAIRPLYYNAPADWGSIRVFPTPANQTALPSPVTITLRGVFLPKITATDLPNYMADRYLDCILHGVKSRLMLQPRKTWTDAQLSIVHATQYERLRNDVRIAVLSDRVPGVTCVRPVRFGG